MKLAVLGCGNMASSIIGGAVQNDFIKGKDIYLFDIDPEKTKTLANEYSCNICSNYADTLKNSDAVLIAVKPNNVKQLLAEIKDKTADKLIISICAGVSIEDISKNVNIGALIARVMPNTPALVGEGVAGICFNENVNETQKSFVISLFEAVGMVFELPEKLIDTVTGLAGSGPAFVFMAIDAMADAGVLEGLSRQDAIKMAAQTFLGAAKLVVSSGKHPAVLKDNVCSPGGTTIEGVMSLEKSGFKFSIIDAVRAAIIKSRKM